jgi:hypothetical protein
VGGDMAVVYSSSASRSRQQEDKLATTRRYILYLVDSVILSQQEKEKKKNYLEPCLEQRCHFAPFVVSTNDLLGREASTLAKRIAQKLAIKI